MKLENCLNWMIFQFPTLYKSRTHAESRLKALNQLFLVIGNGYEWHKDGYLVTCNQENKSKEELESLPEGFFEKHLYQVDVYTTSVDKVKEGFQDRFHYFQEHYIPNQTTCYFESESHQQALELHNKYAVKQAKVVLECLCHYMVYPYPIYECSAIMDVLKGRVKLGQEEFNLVLKPDWLAGCVEIAEEALNYFEDDTRNIDDSYHPIKNIQCMKYDLERSKNGMVFWQKNLKKGETIEEYAQRNWDTHKTQQTKILNKFLAKFKTPT